MSSRAWFVSFIDRSSDTKLGAYWTRNNDPLVHKKNPGGEAAVYEIPFEGEEDLDIDRLYSAEELESLCY